MLKLPSPRLIRCSTKAATRTRTFSTTHMRRDAIHDATESRYRDHISTVRNKLIIVDFYEDWCPPCKVLSPLLERIEQDPSVLGAPASSVDLITLKGDLTPDLFVEHQIKAVPTVKAFYNGREVGEFVGAKKLKDMQEWYSTLRLR